MGYRIGRAARALGLLFHVSLAAVGVFAFGTHAFAEGSPRGRIIGKVVSSATGEPLGFANLALFNLSTSRDSLGTPVGGATSTADGAYRIEAKPGTYWLVASYVTYNPRHVEHVEVSEAGVVSLDLSLVPEALKVETVEVSASVLKNNEAALLAQQRKAAAVSDAVGADQIAKSTDSNAAEVLQRVTGLSVVDDRFVYVRGLGERYSSARVDGMSVGTPEPNKRVLPLDMFASGLIDNIVIQKTYTPDQPGDFGGGTVNISTRDFPGRKLWSFSASSGYNGRSTGKSFLSYRGGHRDFLGFDDGMRDLPDVVGEIAGERPVTVAGPRGGLSPDQLQEITRGFPNIWSAETENGRPPANLSAHFADERKLFGRRLGFNVSGSYSRSYQTTQEKQRSFNPELAPIVDYDVERSEASVLWGGVASGSYRLGRAHTVDLRAIYNRSAEDEVRLTEGFNTDQEETYRLTRLRYVERGLFAGSAGMTHAFRSILDSKLDWRVNYSRAVRNEPDRRESIYQLANSESDDSGEATTAAADPEWIFAYRGSAPPFSRMYGSLHDEERGFEANWAIPFRPWGGLEGKIKSGVLVSGKDRDEAFRRFRYRLGPEVSSLDATQPPESLLAGDNISIKRFVITEDTRDTDSYTAEQRLAAQYAMVDLPVSRRLRLVTGLRVENSEQIVETYDVFSSQGNTIRATVDKTDLLPSVNATYALSERMNLRGAYSRTVNRPDLRELTPLSLTDYSTVVNEAGNPNLRRARIENYDVRWEMYPSSRELLAVSAFYKEFTDPIEKTILITPAPTYLPENGQGATLRGVELEARLGLDRALPPLSRWAATANLTFVDSKTHIEQGEQTSKERPLQGQSPYVTNVGLFYGTPSGRFSGSLLHNVFGRRLAYLGVGVIPDIYEVPRQSLDATLSYVLSPSMRVRVAAENLLDSEVRFEQGDAAHVTQLYKKGRSVSLSLSTGT